VRLKSSCLLALALALAAPASHAADLDSIKSRGVIVALTSANDRPNTYMDIDGKPTGFEVEFCNVLAKSLGVRLQLDVIAWQGILPSLTAGRADIVCSAVNVTAARAEQFDFSLPYSRTNIVAIVPIDSTATGPTDMAGRVVGGPLGAGGDEVIRAIGGYKDIRVYAGSTEVMSDLVAGRLDMVITGDIQGGTFIKNRPGIAKIVGQPYKTNLIAIPMTQGSAALKAAIDQAITNARRDGTIDALAEKYFGLASFTASLPPIGQAPVLSP
jgi:ABC-type amino acid transport substrate-binding protein